jgi:hypothetical protein
LKGTTRMPRLRGSARYTRKWTVGAFVSINRMRAGHSSLKASLSRFNFVSTAECEYVDRCWWTANEHNSWDCKLYEDQRATVMDILSENSKKEYPKSVTELFSALKAREKICARRLLLRKQNS